MTRFPNYQYAFPWSANACRCNLLFQEMTGTTLRDLLRYDSYETQHMQRLYSPAHSCSTFLR